MGMKLVVLGSSNAIPSEGHDNTMLALVGQHSTILIDCGINPVVKFQQAGIDLNSLEHVVITHFHPDHVSGFPILLMSMWLLGRTKKLLVYGSDHTITRLEKLMTLFDWEQWPGFYHVSFVTIPLQPLQKVLETDEITLLGVPVKHFIPTMGLRMEFKHNQKIIGFTCDTEPCPGVELIADGVDILFHEATGENEGHSSPEQAGHTARRNEVGELVLIHYPGEERQNNQIVAKAAAVFTGKITRAYDMQTFEI